MKFSLTYFLLLLYFVLPAQNDTGKIAWKGPVAKHTYTQNSVLASGTWVKVKVDKDNIYKITYDDLVQYGINPATINPAYIQVFGNGGAMLPEDNAAYSPDDLIENAIYVEGEADGHFDKGDYILFYGQSPVKWDYNPSTMAFEHTTNSYTDQSVYFLSFDREKGKRILPQISSSFPPTNIVTNFNDYDYHEKDLVNLLKSGRDWYGEPFNGASTYAFQFSFPYIVPGSSVLVNTSIAARGAYNSLFSVSANTYTDTILVPAIPGPATSDYAITSEGIFSFPASIPAINISVYNNTASSIGWLDFIEVNALRQLKFTGLPMLFRNVASVGTGNISQFKLSAADTSLKIWEVTNPYQVKEQKYTLTGSDLRFTVKTDSLRQFIAFGSSGFATPVFAGKVDNQNLHGLPQTDMVIVAYPDFLSQANRLAAIHALYDNLKVAVVTPQQIYNEFSSGSQDIAAIRNFMRMFYDRTDAPEAAPKYLLLFGDGSYDYKNHLSQNTDFVPLYESNSSLAPTSSYGTDDFFGLLDSTDGSYCNGALDLGIGRLPVANPVQAKQMVDKIENYINKISTVTEVNGCTTFKKEIEGDWRNIFCFVADDEDNNLHISQADGLANYVDTANNNINIQKIYLDAYKQVSSSTGDTYPDVNKAIDKRVNDGALIINYTGHGGETGWAEEKVLQLSDINSWSNSASLPVFVTATCEFSRYDDPEMTSAGEMVLLNPVGGAIALFTTSRLSFSNTNLNLNKSFYKFAVKKYNGKYLRFGDLIRLSKNDNNNVVNLRNFALLGDPALQLSYPENTVVTTKINGKTVPSAIPDTLKALDKVTVSGVIQDANGQKLDNFNGTIYPTIYDKKIITTTLANDPDSHPFNFYQQEQILYHGRASVTNGMFTFSFVLPKDMNDKYGIGRISYYAKDSTTDAGGYYEDKDFVIGGVDNTAAVDNSGPNIRLFMNDTTFVSGNTTDENPLMLAFLSDSSGINTTNFSFGHSITAVLDENTSQSIELNDYFTQDMNNYQGGVIRYPFINLSYGSHSLRLKAFDVYNNSSEASIEFVVVSPEDLFLKNFSNYPNPFSNKTTFSFNYAQLCCELEVEIKIYSIMGALVKTISQTIEASGTGNGMVEWDGKADNGSSLSNGMYLYNIVVKTIKGNYLTSSNKLILLN